MRGIAAEAVTSSGLADCAMDFASSSVKSGLPSVRSAITGHRFSGMPWTPASSCTSSRWSGAASRPMSITSWPAGSRSTAKLGRAVVRIRSGSAGSSDASRAISSSVVWSAHCRSSTSRSVGPRRASASTTAVIAVNVRSRSTCGSSASASAKCAAPSPITSARKGTVSRPVSPSAALASSSLARVVSSSPPGRSKARSSIPAIGYNRLAWRSGAQNAVSTALPAESASVDQRVGEARLADTRLPPDHQHAAPAIRCGPGGDGLPPLAQSLPLRLPPHEPGHGRALGLEAVHRRRRADHAEHLHVAGDALHRRPPERLHREEAAHDLVGVVADHHRALGRERLEPRRLVRRGADDAVVSPRAGRAHLAHQHDTGVDADAGGDFDALLASDGGRHRVERTEELEPREHGLASVVLARLGEAEVGHDPVADVVGDLPPVRGDGVLRELLVTLEHVAHRLGLVLLRHLGRAHEVDEHHRQLASLTTGRRRSAGARRGVRRAARRARQRSIHDEFSVLPTSSVRVSGPDEPDRLAQRLPGLSVRHPSLEDERPEAGLPGECSGVHGDLHRAGTRLEDRIVGRSPSLGLIW